MSHDAATRAVVEVIDAVAARIRRHLGPCTDHREREFEAVCPDGRRALEIVMLWPAPVERTSLVDLALADAERELVARAGRDQVTRDRLEGDSNVRILATGIGRELAVFGPGGDEIGDRLLVTGLGPCR